jgi:phosphate/sulfate permease
MLSALFAAAVFLFLATSRKLPVSTTHAIVGGIVGITMGANRDVYGGLSGVFHGAQCVDWSLQGFGGMVVSWVVSPVLAGALCCLLYSATSRFIYSDAKMSPATRDIELPSHSFSGDNGGGGGSSGGGGGGVNHQGNKNSSEAPTERTLNLLPVCYSGMTWIMVFLICSKSAATKVNSLLYTAMLCSLLTVLLRYLLALFVLFIIFQ